MQIESHATPPTATPQLRYAALHRAVEQGLASDEVWRELAEVCFQLGHQDESIRCVRHIENPTLRNAMESRLDRLGLRVEAKTTIRAPARGPVRDASPDHADEEPAPGRVVEHFGDAMQYLLLQHMPWLVLAATLSFPVLIGVGGFLTAGGSLLLLAGIAALPGLAILSLVGAMGRRIFRQSHAGSNDVPAVGDFGGLVDDAQRFLVDTALVLVTFLAPPIAALLLGAPWTTTVPCMLLGAFFAPMAWALRNLRGDFAALSPVVLVRAVSRAPLQYTALTAVCWSMLAPAALAEWLVMDRPIWVQITMVGPITVLPLFVACRMMGTWFETRRRIFGALLGDAAHAAATAAPANAGPGVADKAPADKAAAGKAPAGKAPAGRAPAGKAPAAQRRPTARPAPAGDATPPRLPPRPDQLRYHAARDVHESRAAAPPASVRRRAADPRPAPAEPPRTPPPREIEGRQPKKLTDGPDLSKLPGAIVVKGKDRKRQGAAARPQ